MSVPGRVNLSLMVILLLFFGILCALLVVQALVSHSVSASSIQDLFIVALAFIAVGVFSLLMGVMPFARWQEAQRARGIGDANNKTHASSAKRKGRPKPRKPRLS